MTTKKPYKINILLILIIGLIVFVSFFFHELAHYLMGTSLGYDMKMSLNSVRIDNQTYSEDYHKLLVTAAGPIFTIITAFIAFFMLKKRNNPFLYIVLFVAFAMRSLAAGISLLFNPNDEARLSQAFDMGVMTLPAIVSICLFGLLFWIARSIKKQSSYAH